MGSLPKKSWKIDGCKGSFFLRGKNNIIWYRRSRNDRFSTGLAYTPKNRILAGQKVKSEENRGVINSEIKTLRQAIEYLIQTTKQKTSENTREHYYSRFSVIFPDQSKHINDFTYVQNCLEVIKNSDRANVTIRNYYVLVATLYNHLMRRKIINSTPISREDLPKVQKKFVETYSNEELEQLYNYFRAADYNFYLYIRFLYVTAFRMNEARTLRKSQVITDNKYREQIIIGKSKFGDRTDYFPLTDAVKSVLNEIEGIWEMKQYDYIFECSAYSKPYVFRKFKNAMIELGLPFKTVDYEGKGRSFHTLRKTRITHWIKAGISIHGLEKLSRDSYATVRQYYDAVETDSYDKFVD